LCMHTQHSSSSLLLSLPLGWFAALFFSVHGGAFIVKRHALFW
jgi:hypothetical protein